MKLFEWIGSLIAILCLAEVVHNPKQVVEDIRRGPAPCLSCLNEKLQRPSLERAARRQQEISHRQ